MLYEIKTIPGYEKHYLISGNGKVFSQHRPGAKAKELKQQKVRGYRKVTLSKEGKVKAFFVHRLVALAFLNKPEGTSEINHKNGNKSDNRYTNLEWCDSQWNHKHLREVLGYSTDGQNNPKAKLTNREVRFIRWLKAHYPTIEAKKISEFYGVTPVAITSAINFKNWKNI